MSRARKLADLLDASGDVRNDAMDNVALSDLNVTATHAEVNTLDGITATTSELNIMDGVTATTAELNIMDGVTATTTEINYLDGVTSNVQTQIDNASTSLSDLSITATASEINTLDGVTATTAELNLLDGVTATTTELNYVDGVTSNIQTQIDNIASDLVDDTTPQLGGVLDTNGNNIEFGDSTGAEVERLKFGAGDDLSIYHDGSNSYIDDSGTGNLKIRGANVNIEKYTGETMAEFIADGETNLRYNHELKLKTTADGIEALRPASNGTIQSWKRGTTEVAKLSVGSTDNVEFSAMQGGGAGLLFWGAAGTDPVISPMKQGVSSDNTVELGRSNVRFKKFHLSEWGTAPAGTIIQVAKQNFNGAQTNSSTSYADITGCSMNFACKSATSLVRVTLFLHNGGKGSIRILANGGSIMEPSVGYAFYTNEGQSNWASSSNRDYQTLVAYYDPNTTASRTYKAQMRSYGTNANVRFGVNEAFNSSSYNYAFIQCEEIAQ